MTKRRIARNVARNLFKLSVAIVMHVSTELRIRAKWLYKDMLAIIRGYKSHAHYMQFELDFRIRHYEFEKELYKISHI